MEYKFYGWETTGDIRPVSEEYKDISSPLALYDALSRLWCKYTCAPKMRNNWNPDNKTLGQCSITSFLVQDIFGGKVFGISLPDEVLHCYNIIDGNIFDLTSEQFGGKKLDYLSGTEQSRETHFSRDEKRLRYEYLRSRLDDYLNGSLPSDLPGGFFVYENNKAEELLYVEDNVIKLFGCDTLAEFREFTGNSFRGMVDPDDLQKIENQIQAQTVFGEKRHDYVRYRIRTKQGETKYIEDFGHLLHASDGKSYYYVFIVDVDQNEFLNRNRNSLAEAEILSSNQEIDPLTGLFNMSFFYHSVQKLLSTPSGRRQELSIIHFDIPNFKLFNERNGFKLGDELLCDFAKTIHEEFKDGIAARFSDDHFVVCISADLQDVVNMMGTVYRKMLHAKDANKSVRIKAGVYCMNDRMTETGLACDHARLACNSIKGRHDLFYCVYDEMLRDKLRKQQYVIDHLDEAIENKYIQVYYQPVVRVKTEEICGYEALVRWVDPKVGVLSPADFIDTLEQYHLIHRIDTYVVEQVCRDYRYILDSDYSVVPASLNFSRLDFELCDIFKIVEDTRKKYDVPRNMLDLEITESAMNENFGHIKEECRKMHEMGYQVWLDDFGSGYSSLNTLTEYSFDVLKLDMVFLRNFDHNPKTAKLMNFIIEGAKGMGLMPLCEGVETREHFEFLKKAGCEKAQGYYFGKPMPLEETRAHALSKGMTWEKIQ